MRTDRLLEHLEKLNAFRLVGELQSVQKAALRLRRTQPAVSRAVKALEDALECRLTERKAGGIRLTPEGERLLRYSQRLAGSVAELEAGEAPAKARALRIATYDNVACRILSALAAKLAREVGGFSLHVTWSNAKMLGDLMGEATDCALLAEPRVLPGLHYRKLFTERYGLFASPAVARRLPAGKLPVSALRGFPIIAMPEAIAGANKTIDRLLWEVGLPSQLAINSYELAMRLTLEGQGIGIMPFSSAWRDLRGKRLRELELKGMSKASFGTHDISLCWSAGKPHPKVGAFEAVVAEFYSGVRA